MSSQSEKKKKHKKSSLSDGSRHGTSCFVSSRVDGHILNGTNIKMKNQETQSEVQIIKLEPEEDIAIMPNEDTLLEEDIVDQNREDRQDKLSDGTTTTTSKKKKKRTRDSTVSEDNTGHESALTFVPELEGTLESLKPSSKKKKRNRVEDSIANSSSCVDPSNPEQPDLAAPLSAKKKKKKKKHENNDEHQMTDLSFAEQPDADNTVHLNEGIKKKKKQQKNEEDVEDPSNPEQPDLAAPLSAKKQKKKKKHENNDEHQMTDLSFAEQPDADNTVHLNGGKKKKKKQQKNEADVEGNLSVTEPPNEDDTVTSKKAKKAKKRQHPSQVEGNLSVTEPPNEDDTVTSKKAKKAKKRQHPSQVEGNLSVTEPPNEDDTVTSKKAKKAKKRQHPSQVEDLLFADDPSTEDTLTLKKKMHQNQDQNHIIEEPTFSEQLDTDNAFNSKKKKRRKKHQQEDETQVEEEPTFSEQLDTDNAFNSKKKKKKKKYQQEEETQVEDEISFAEQPVTEDDLHTKKKKKKKKHQNDEENQVESSVLLPEPAPECCPGPSFVADTDDAVAPRKKKKKKNHQAEEQSQVEDSTEVTAAETATTSVKKKSRKRARREEAEAADLPESRNDVPDLPCSSADPPNEKGKRQAEVPGDSSDDDFDVDDLLFDSRKGRKSNVLACLRQSEIDLLEEYFPKLRSLKNSTVYTIVTEDLERIKDAKRNGITYLRGRFTTKENKQLKKNVEEFMSLTGIKNGEKLFHSHRFPEEKAVIEQTKRSFNFRHRIAENIPRTIQEICRRGGKIYDLSTNKGRYSKEEVDQLKKYWSIHGNQWIKIGNLVGRNNVTVQLKASQLKRDINRGSWSRKEINKLVKAVKKFILSSKGETTTKNGQKPKTISKRKLYEGIPWVQIEEKVNTRNWSQCKTKWTDILLSRMNYGSNVLLGTSGLDVKIEIIKWLYDSKIKESGQVNWADLADHIGNIPPMMVQLAFYRLKSKYILNWQNMKFKDIVHRLYTVAIPAMEELLAKKKYEKQMFAKNDVFAVDEIFHKITKKHKAKKLKQALF